MRLTELLDRLPEDAVASMSLSVPDCEIHNVAFLTATPHETLLEDVLYFSDSVLLPELVPESQLFNCIVVDGAPDDSALRRQASVNLVWLAQATDLFACYNAIQATFLEDQRLSDIVRRLLAAHFSNQGLQYLVEEAASALGNPIVVVDPTYRYIAYHLGALPSDETTLARVMVEEIANETVLEDAVAYIRDSQIDSKIARSKGPFEQYNEMLDCNTMTAAVMVRGVCIAHVMMMERSHPFSTVDREVFSRLTHFVGQELQKSELWGPTTGELGSYFLENLLNDRSPSVAVTRRRMKALDFHPKELLYVVCLHASGEGLSQVQVEHIAGQLRPLLHHALYTRHHQQLVVLLSRDADVGFSAKAEAKLREVAALNNLTVGVSNIYTDIIDTRRAYEQARAAIRYGQMASSAIDDDGLFRYCDYGYLHMFELTGRRTNLLALCHPALLALVDYDAAHGGELVETLYWYLQLSCSTARAAELLCLHKNTMLYRLGRIRTQLGMDLSSGEDLFALQLGLRILISLGLFVPRLRVSRDQLRTPPRDKA
jgi:hypothetical protein